MKGPRGLVTIGTFHLRGGPGTVELWSAVSLTDYPAITVTREPEDGKPRLVRPGRAHQPLPRRAGAT
jgi:hypothetical protein